MEGHLIFIVLSCLLSGACSLSCYECMPSGAGPCKDTKTNCPSPTQCGSLRIVSSAGGQVVSDMNMKMCVMPKQCIVGSVNLGLMKTVINSKCCQTDNCNAQSAPASTGGANGKECYTCTGPDCSTKMKCEGVEDRCVTAKLNAGDQMMKVKGCASRSVCTGEIAEQLQSLGEITCCEGNLCNGDNKRSATDGSIRSTSSWNTIMTMVLSLACFLFSP